jgi:hypothetical protein
MKLKKFNQLFEREGFDDIDQPFDEEDEYSIPDEDDYDPSSDDDMEHLCYLLRQMFNNSNIDVNVENSGLDVSITAQFDRKESLKDVIRLFEIVKKIKKDILAQYDSSYEMWETRSGNPMITFDFNLDEDSDKDGVTTGDKDDYPW